MLQSKLRMNNKLTYREDNTEKSTELFDSDSARLLMAGLVSRKISHKINNLLTPLFAFPEIIKADLNNKEAAYEMLNGTATRKKR